MKGEKTLKSLIDKIWNPEDDNISTLGMTNACNDIIDPEGFLPSDVCKYPFHPGTMASCNWHPIWDLGDNYQERQSMCGLRAIGNATCN